MSQDYKAGVRRSSDLISYIISEDSRDYDKTLEHASRYIDIPEEATRRTIDYLHQEGYLTITTTLDGEETYIVPDPTLGRHLPGAVTDQIGLICAPPLSAAGPITRRGGQGGNTNALKHGKFSTRFNNLANHTTKVPQPDQDNPLDRPLELLRATIEDLAAQDEPEPQLLIHAIATYAKLVITARSLALK